MSNISITERDVADAKSDVQQFANDLDAGGFYPESMMRNAPTAVAGRDVFIERWDRRRNAELDGLETLILAFDLIRRAFVAADERLAADLARLGTIELDDGGRD